jgi:hypothetical protein
LKKPNTKRAGGAKIKVLETQKRQMDAGLHGVKFMVLSGSELSGSSRFQKRGSYKVVGINVTSSWSPSGYLKLTSIVPEHSWY